MSFKLSRGYDSLDELQQEADARRGSGTGVPFRFRLQPGESARATFLTDNPPVVKEHTIQTGPKKWENFTCLSLIGQACPLCDAGDKAAATGFYMLIDHREQKGKDNKVYKDTVRVYAPKLQILQTLAKQSIKAGGLVGQRFEIERLKEPTSPNTGSLFDRENKFSVSELETMLGRPLSEACPDEFWNEYLKPDPDAVRRVAGVKAKASDEEDAPLNYGK